MIRIGRNANTVPTPWIKPSEISPKNHAGVQLKVSVASASSVPSTWVDSQSAMGVAIV